MRFIPIVLFLSMGVLLAQPPQTASLASPPPPPPIISASVVGNQGQSTYNYWVVANYPGGSAVGQLASVIFAPNALTSTNSIRVSWAKLSGVTTFDVIRLTPPATFTGVCSACAVAIGLSGTVQEMNDIGASVASYTQGSPAQGAAGQLYINTLAYTPPQIRQVVNGVDSAIGGGGGSGATIPATTNLIAGDGAGNGANSGIVPATVGLLAAVQSFTNKTLDGISPTIMGYLSNVTSDIQAQLNSKQATITTGITAQYFRGDLSLATFPTIPTVTGGTCTNQFVSAISTSAVPTCTTPVLNSGQFANQGTVTTLLHGNAAGNPSFSQVVNADITNGTVDLTSKVTGLLPHANIAATAVTPGSYTNGNFTVGADGSLTAASNGTAGGVTSVTATPPLVVTGTTTPNVSGSYEGNGSKIQLFTGADPATNDCAKFDVNHNVLGAGAPCGGGTTGGGAGVSYCSATGGASNALACTPSAALTAYTSGVGVSLKVDAANIGATTINVNSLGAKNLFLKGAALLSGSLQQCVTGGCFAYYDGTQFNLVAPNPSNVFNVRDFGAIPDGATDNYQAITNSISSACAAASASTTGQRSVLYFPASPLAYAYTQVPHVNCSNIRVRGDGLGTTLTPSYTGGGASFLLGPAVGSGSLAVPTTTALLTGAGSAMVISGNGNYLNLSDTPGSRVGGLSAITVEFSMNLTGLGDGIILSSAGNGINFGAFTVGVSGGQLYSQLNIAGTITTLGFSTSLSTATLYHVALDYDGSTVRLFLNGALYGGTAARTGTVQQAVNEDVIIPGRMQSWPDGALESTGASGVVDNVRISNIARYTTTFTPPTAKFSYDSNTQVLVIFSNQYDVFSTVTSIGGNTAPVMYRSAFTGGVINQTEMQDLTFNLPAFDTGPIFTKNARARHSGINVNGGSNGMLLVAESFINTIYDYTGQAGTGTYRAKYQIAASSASGALQLINSHLFGGSYIFAMYGGSVDWTGGWLQTESETIEAIHVVGAGGTVFSGRGLNANTESGGAAVSYLAEFSGLDQINITDSKFESTAASPSFWFNNNNGVTLSQILVSGSTSATNGVAKITNTANPVVLINPTDTDGSPAPWSDTLNLVSLLQSGRITNASYATNTNCSSSATPAVCGSAPSGSFVVAATATTATVNTTAVTANSQIQITFDSSLGTKLGVTCNTTIPTLYGLSAPRTAGTSFTLTSTAPITNPACFSYTIIN